MEATTSAQAPATAAAEAAKRDFDALQKRDPDAMKAAYAEHAVVDFVPLGLVLRGNEELRRFFFELFAAVPDLETTYDIVATSGDAAVVEYHMRGTHLGSFQGVDATGKHLELRGCDVMHVEGDLIVRNTAYYDGMAFARQIGMMPAQDSGAEKAMKSAFNAATKLRARLAQR
jgi:steroid delta-isomerase-like uncharacterized protein